MTNKDQVKGGAKDIGGKIKEEVGDAIGNDQMKRDGQADQIKGKVQKGIGDVKDKLSDWDMMEGGQQNLTPSFDKVQEIKIDKPEDDRMNTSKHPPKKPAN